MHTRPQTPFQKQQARDANLTHGLTGHPLHRVWATMKGRCVNPAVKSFKDYGAKGITVCGEWLAFEPFHRWMLANGWQKGLEIDRIDNTKGYAPENCRVVTRSVNARNRPDVVQLTVNSRTRSANEWAEAVGLKPATVRRRLARGATPEEAIAPLTTRRT